MNWIPKLGDMVYVPLNGDVVLGEITQTPNYPAILPKNKDKYCVRYDKRGTGFGYYREDELIPTVGLD
jgi:hypothetical protein